MARSRGRVKTTSAAKNATLTPNVLQRRSPWCHFRFRPPIAFHSPHPWTCDALQHTPHGFISLLPSDDLSLITPNHSMLIAMLAWSWLLLCCGLVPFECWVGRYNQKERHRGPAVGSGGIYLPIDMSEEQFQASSISEEVNMPRHSLPLPGRRHPRQSVRGGKENVWGMDPCWWFWLNRTITTPRRHATRVTTSVDTYVQDENSNEGVRVCSEPCKKTSVSAGPRVCIVARTYSGTRRRKGRLALQGRGQHSCRGMAVTYVIFVRSWSPHNSAI